MTLRMVRLAAKKQIWTHAARHFIVDFSDAVVTQRHRDFKDGIIAASQANEASVNSAATVQDVLVVFDSIAEFL